MTNRGCRLIGSAVVAAAGCVTVGISEHSTATSFQSGAGVVGGITLLVGGLLFYMDWVSSFCADIRSDSSKGEH